MSKLDDLIQKLCPDGVEYKPLSEIFNTRNGYTPSKKEKNFWENGTVPWFRMEDIRENGGILDHAMQYVSINAIKGDPFPENSIIVATSATIGEHALITVPSIANQRFTYLMIKNQYRNEYDPKFLYYYCFKLDEYCKECLNQGNFASVDMKKFSKFQFPRLPMEIQREIVGVLDNYTEVTAKIKVSLEKELVARQKQYEFYRDKLLTFDVLRGGTIDFRWRMLCEIADISTGNSNTNEAVEDGKYPFFVRSQEPLRKNDFEYDEAAIITAGDGVGVGKVYHYIEGKYALHQRAYRIHINTSEVVPKYYFHYMKAKFLPYIQKTMFQGSVASIRRPMLNAFPVPVPPLDVQNRIVNVLDNFEKICSDLNIGLPAEIEARQKQYEYYRDKLLTFAEIGNTILSRAEQSRALIKLLQYVFGYAVVTLEDIAENCDSMRKPVTSGKREAGEYPYYGASGIVDYVKDYIFDGDYLLVSEDGANLLARSTPIAFSISGKNWVNNHAHVLKFDCYETRRFIEFYLNSIDLSSYISGGAQPKLNQKNLNRIEIPLPSQERQKYIVEILDRFDTICNDLTSGLPAEIEARQKQYEYYRDKLLTFKEVAAT